MGTNRPHRLIPGTLLLTFAVLCLCNCASNGGSVPAASPHAAGEPQIDHRAFVAVHIKRGPKRPLEISPGPPEGDTNDECITVPTGWECVIQGGTNTDGAFDSIEPAGATITWNAPPPTQGVTFTPATFTTSTPPYQYNYTETASPTAPVGNQYSAVVNVTVSGSPSFCQVNYCGSGSATTYFQVSCALSLHQCPVLQIKDNNLGKIVSGSPPPVTKTVVGYQASVTAAAAPNTGSGSYGAPSSVQWKIPGTLVKDYDHTTGTKTPLPSGDLQIPNPIFYWIAGGSNQPQVSGKLTRSDKAEIADVQTTANYNVQVPAFTASAPVRHDVYVGSRSDQSGLFLTDGDATTTKAGINFSYNVTNTYGFAGQVVGTQLVDPSYTYDGSTQMPTSGAFWLDNQPNYENPVNAGTTWSAIDAPGEALTSSNKSAGITGKFQMYYMYQAKSPSIWVTLSEVTWNWSASAARIGNPNTWCLGGATGCPDTTKPSTPDSAVSNSSALPIWNGKVYKNATSSARRLPGASLA